LTVLRESSRFGITWRDFAEFTFGRAREHFSRMRERTI